MQTIGRYEIQQELGRGGMAVVYLALDPQFDRQVAVKTITGEAAEDAQFRKRFVREAKVIARLQHPAIVPVHDFGDDNGRLFMVMRLMEGGSLKDLLRQGPLPVTEAARIYQRLAPAIDAAHSRGIVHRDLKPANILFDEWGKPYIADFGIVKLLEGETSDISQTGFHPGTIAYMSPEQLTGREIDGRSDVYAMGVMLYEILSGELPYRASNPGVLVTKILYDPIPDLLKINKELPAKTQSIIEKAMVKDQKDRYQSAVELASDLTGLAAVERMIDTPPPPAQGRKVPAWAWWVSALTLLLVVAFGIRQMMGAGGDDEGTPAAGEAPAEGAALVVENTATPMATADPKIPPANAALGDSWTRPADGMAMVYVPAGSFPMGSADGESREEPVHEVALDSFWIDQTEVSNAQYSTCVAKGDCQPSRLASNATYNGADFPVAGVSWYDADSYCAWAGGSLPTEAQWEYAARGPESREYSWGNEDPTCELAQFYGCGGETVPVGSYPNGASWVGALDKAHQKGIIHRDLKPGNVLFDEDGQPYLADFGIARMAEATHTMTIVGTPAYMSPEQVRGKIKLDGRSDLYALGVVLFEMLTARRPYEADTPSGQMFMHVMDPIPDIREFNPDLPAATQAVINRALAKDRQDRYQSAGELAAAVSGLATTASTSFAGREAPPAAIAVLESGPISEIGPLSAAEQTMIDTPPEITPPPQEPLTANLPPQESLNAANSGVEGAISRPVDGRKVPGWAWWGGALALLAVGIFGLRGILSGGGGAASEAATGTTSPSKTPTITPSPTPTLDPNIPPPNAELGDNWTRPADGMTMVYVPAGSFAMGSEDRGSDEQPVHEVALDSFWIDRTEVSNWKYNICVAEGDCQPSRFASEETYNGADFPVVGVSWYDADSYCAWAGGSLPTEAQWEYAARGPEGWKYPWGEKYPTCDLAQFGGCDGDTIPVGSYPDGASWVGALDMAGNVWEWVQDWYGKEYYSTSPATNPLGPASGDSKVLRGGSWYNSRSFLRSAYRSIIDPTLTDFSIGFRCVVVSGS